MMVPLLYFFSTVVSAAILWLAYRWMREVNPLTFLPSDLPDHDLQKARNERALRYKRALIWVAPIMAALLAASSAAVLPFLGTDSRWIFACADMSALIAATFCGHTGLDLREVRVAVEEHTHKHGMEALARSKARITAETEARGSGSATPIRRTPGSR